MRACVLCFALLLTYCYCAALLLLHARPPARCAAAALPWPCKPARHTHTHHPYPHLDQPASDLKASDDGAPLLLSCARENCTALNCTVLHDCAFPPPPPSTSLPRPATTATPPTHRSLLLLLLPLFLPPRATDRPPPLSRPPPCLPALPTGSTRSVHTRFSNTPPSRDFLLSHGLVIAGDTAVEQREIPHAHPVAPSRTRLLSGHCRAVSLATPPSKQNTVLPLAVSGFATSERRVCTTLRSLFFLARITRVSLTGSKNAAPHEIGQSHSGRACLSSAHPLYFDICIRLTTRNASRDTPTLL